MTDKELTTLIKEGGRSENLALGFLAQQPSYRNMARSAASKVPNGLELQIDHDIFWHGLGILCDAVRNGIFQGKSSLLTYFASICFRSARDITGPRPIHNSEETLTQIEGDHLPDFRLIEASEKQELLATFDHICEKMGEKHGKILKMKLNSYPNDRIANELGLPYAAVKDRVARSYKKFKDFLEQHPVIRERLYSSLCH